MIGKVKQKINTFLQKGNYDIDKKKTYLLRGEFCIDCILN